MNVPTQIICCMRCSSISCDSMHEFEYIPPNSINVFPYKHADYILYYFVPFSMKTYFTV